MRRIRSAFHANRNDHLTRAIVLAVKPGLIQWPAVMISKNRIRFNQGDTQDEVIIDAWLNKSKSTIIKEIKDLGMSRRPW